MRRIVAVRPLDGYRVWVRFADDVEGEVSLADLVGQGVFAQWEDPANFAEVSIDPQTHTLAWPGGIGLCPDALYEDVVRQKTDAATAEA
jgi:hypothetical protein